MSTSEKEKLRISRMTQSIISPMKTLAIHQIILITMKKKVKLTNIIKLFLLLIGEFSLANLKNLESTDPSLYKTVKQNYFKSKYDYEKDKYISK